MPDPLFAQMLAASGKGGRPRFVDLYHAVRRIPYGAVGGRDPMLVLRHNVGSCSGKHMLLRELLVAAGYKAEIITIRTFFNRGVPDIPSMDAELRELVSRRTVVDFHHYVRLETDGKLLRLDATWDDDLIHYGFPVNHLWEGETDTRLAAVPLHEYPEPADLAAFKTGLLEAMPSEEKRLRERFFALLTDWMSSIRLQTAANA